MEQTSFYVTLLSNAQAPDLFTTNRPDSFTNLLPTAVKLPGLWEVGVKEIQFTHSWKFKTPEFRFIAWLHKDEADISNESTLNYLDKETADLVAAEGLNIDRSKMRYELIYMEQGTWNTVDEAADELANLLSRSFQQNVMWTKADSTWFFCKHPFSLGFLSEESELFELLGIILHSEQHENYYVYQFDEVNTGKCEPSEPTLTHTEVFLYSNFIEDSFVGGRKARLLATVPVTSSWNKTQAVFYKEPLYKSIPESMLDYLHVDVCGREGNNVVTNSKSALTTLLLHFRKIRKRFV